MEMIEGRIGEEFMEMVKGRIGEGFMEIVKGRIGESFMETVIVGSNANFKFDKNNKRDKNAHWIRWWGRSE